MTTGHLECEYLPIWVRNMQKCEISKNYTFSKGPRSWKSSIFFDFLESLLNWWENHHMTTGHLKFEFYQFGWEICKNVKLAKMTLFRQVRGHENLQFFRLSEKPFKLMKNTTTWPQDTWNVNIYPFGWEICKNVKLAKMTLFRQVCGHENVQFFRLLESLLNWWKTPPHDHRSLEMWIFTHLCEKYANMWN